jgi:hypothetical protein
MIFAERNQSPVGELAIDKVFFLAGSRQILHYEIEIESLSRFDHSAIKEAMSFLTEKFSSLAPWKYDKLTTVNAIIELIGCGRLDGISSEGHLEKSAYDKILVKLEGE